MAQTAPPSSVEGAPRPLPRRPSAAKAIRAPRLVPQDGAWMAALAVAAALVAAQLSHPTPTKRWMIGVGISVVTTALLYLLGWRARDRAAGIIAGLLLATSLPFALHSAAAPRDALLAMLTVAALLSFVAGSSLLALAVAGLAAATRPDALLLGLVLAGLALAQRRRYAALGAGLFVVFASVGWAALISLGYQPFPKLHLEFRGGTAAWAISPGIAFISWMMLPFCAEFGEAPRRARWLPVVLWTLIYSITVCFVRIGDFAMTLFPLQPLWFVMAGGGLSRLLPTLIGEIPSPGVRYLLATVAVVSLLVMRYPSESRILRPAPTAVLMPVPVVPLPAHLAPPAILAAPVVPATLPQPLHPLPKPALMPKPMPMPMPEPMPKTAPVTTHAPPKATAAKPPAAKPSVPDVPLFILRNGRLVHRSAWAIAWDRAHRGTH